jgi:hypothetical protein
MKSENIELLVLDRALGQLPPETAELLDEYLRQNPVAAERAIALGETVGLARGALRIGDAVVADGQPSGWARARRTARWHALAGQGWKLAACVALGLVLGRSLRPPGRAPVSVASSISAVQSRASGPGALNPAAAFWIAERRAAVAKDRAAQPKTVPWEALEVARTKGDLR